MIVGQDWLGDGTGPLDYETRDPVPDPETLPYKYTKATVHSAMTLHVKYGTFVLWRQHIGMIIS